MALLRYLWGFLGFLSKSKKTLRKLDGRIGHLLGLRDFTDGALAASPPAPAAPPPVAPSPPTESEGHVGGLGRGSSPRATREVRFLALSCFLNWLVGHIITVTICCFEHIDPVTSSLAGPHPSEPTSTVPEDPHPTPAADAPRAAAPNVVLLQIDMETMTLCGASCLLGTLSTVSGL